MRAVGFDNGKYHRRSAITQRRARARYLAVEESKDSLFSFSLFFGESRIQFKEYAPIRFGRIPDSVRSDVVEANGTR